MGPSPFQVNEEIYDENGNNCGEKTLEVLYQGYYYDVTEFARRHPGGNVIYFYTKEGEDATIAMQQFHHRFSNKVDLMLKGFKKRKAAEFTKVTKPSETTKRRDEMTADLLHLFQEMKEEGLFAPSLPRVWMRMAEVVMFAVLAYLFLRVDSILFHLLGSFCFSMAIGRGGWLMHEGGHHSLTGKPNLDRIIMSVFMGVFGGLSSKKWGKCHSMHHAMPQRLDHDADLATMPILAYHEKVVKNKKEGQNFFVQNQAWLYLPLDCFLGYVAWTLYISPMSCIKKRDFLDLTMMALHWILCYFTFPAFSYFILAHWIGATYTFGNFALSHTHLPVTEEDGTHWLEYGLTHTANVNSNILVDWWMGYLNFQIEHHLFPTLPQFRCHKISERVKKLAKKYNLKYHSYNYFDAGKRTLKNFKDVSHSIMLG